MKIKNSIKCLLSIHEHNWKDESDEDFIIHRLRCIHCGDIEDSMIAPGHKLIAIPGLELNFIEDNNDNDNKE